MFNLVLLCFHFFVIICEIYKKFMSEIQSYTNFYFYIFKWDVFSNETFLNVLLLAVSLSLYCQFSYFYYS